MSRADKVYYAVPTLTAFTLVRSDVKEQRNYVLGSGQQVTPVETSGRKFVATLTTYKPVTNDKGQVLRYLDLGDDEFNYPAAVEQPAQGENLPVAVLMSDIVTEEIEEALRLVLVEVMANDVADFADQPVQMVTLGAQRFFAIDRIKFSGREDKPKEAMLSVLLGVYADEACTQIKRYVQQDFVSASKLAELQSSIDLADSRIKDINAQIAQAETTVEQKGRLRSDLATITAERTRLEEAASETQLISSVLGKPAVKQTVRAITEAVLADAKARNPAYSSIDVEALGGLFDGAYASLIAKVS